MRPYTRPDPIKLAARKVESRARKERVEEYARQMLVIVREERGITVDAMRTRFPSDGHAQWDASGALDLITGYGGDANTPLGHGIVEVQRGKHNARHLVMRESPPEYMTLRAIDLRKWME